MGEFGYQAGIAVAAVHLINWLKDTKMIPFVNQHSQTINRIIAFMAAVIGGLGVHTAWQGDLTSGGELRIAYPPLDVMVASFAHIAAQWGFQKVYFRLQAPPIDTSVSVTTISPAGTKGSSIGVTEAHSFPSADLAKDPGK